MISEMLLNVMAVTGVCSAIIVPIALNATKKSNNTDHARGGGAYIRWNYL